MVKPFLRYVLSSGVACVGFGLALHGGDARALVVNVGGSNYDVTTISGTYDSLLPTLSTQPWFGNSTLAASFRNAVWDGMGLPNLGLYGPAFATRADFDEFEGSYYSIVSVYNLGDGTFDDYPLTTTDTNFIYAQAQLQPSVSPVPGPLPLFGAMAGYGMTRRLRARIKPIAPKRVVF